MTCPLFRGSQRYNIMDLFSTGIVEIVESIKIVANNDKLYIPLIGLFLFQFLKFSMAFYRFIFSEIAHAFITLGPELSLISYSLQLYILKDSNSKFVMAFASEKAPHAFVGGLLLTGYICAIIVSLLCIKLSTSCTTSRIREIILRWRNTPVENYDVAALTIVERCCFQLIKFLWKPIPILLSIALGFFCLSVVARWA